MRAVIDQLDSRRAQVYVETMIIEVNANKAADVGFQCGRDRQNGDKYGPIGGTNFGTGSDNIINLSFAAATGQTVLPSRPQHRPGAQLLRHLFACRAGPSSRPTPTATSSRHKPRDTRQRGGASPSARTCLS
jgi:hypothetical protein